ncbi:aldehyde dehydrogenase [Saccharopolyspora phatthalungensis]|uniref:Aldehyde dehydrogenase (NAD+) n=1 Tax=Saccharopolyspora phatthalungensis TaxID=664693 RepID=A0A840QF93_9PSEU|nr:aldehyde dehydrogenase [Saccharopolyspora phatthalungensis]MBB5157259.1 aldehyde dehydrogenase (NAD+) [Saccharopolyspora phatthalungensis]
MPSTELRHCQMYIGNTWMEAETGERFETVNPFTGRPWASAPLAGPADVRKAVQAAERALEGPWAKMSATQRGDLIRRLADLIGEHAEELATIETTDNGKVIRETRGQLQGMPATYDYFAGAADKIHGATIPSPHTNFFTYTRREPIGVVAAILPWNSPLYLLASKLAPALAAGCTFVAKPAEQTPMSTLRFAELVAEAGFPDGVFNVVTGGGETGAALAADPGVAKVTFTGSTATGTAVMKSAADHIADVTLELGGKSPNIVCADADLDAAMNGVLAGIFAATGQTCIAGSRLLVARELHDELVDRLVRRIQSIKLGDPLLMETEVGPIAFAEQLDKVCSYVDIARTEGASLVCGGKRPNSANLRDGYFFEPTILTEVHNDMRVAREEIFGPVLSVIPFDTEDEAVRIANDTSYGLAAAVWTRDIQRAHRMAHQIHAGSIWINSYRVLAYNVPYGGFRQSGIGRENGIEGLDAYLQTKSVWVELTGASRDPFKLG